MRAINIIKELANSIGVYENTIVECKNIISEFETGEDFIQSALNLAEENQGFRGRLNKAVLDAVTDFGDSCQGTISKIEEKFENGQTKNLTQYIIED